MTACKILSDTLDPALPVNVPKQTTHRVDTSLPVINNDRFHGTSPGNYSPKVIETFVLKDKQRNKDLQLRISYPDSGQSFPVIVWSHGAKGSKDMYNPLIEHWVSHGYVCIQPNHFDSRDFASKGGKAQTLRGWHSRPEDIVLVLDSLDEIEQRVSGSKVMMNGSMIGVGGHSFGAHTAQLVGGARVCDPGSSNYLNYRDDRISAIMLVSPQGSGRESLLDAGSWQNMHTPAISITGSKDSGRAGKNWCWRLEPFIHASSDDKYLVYIDGAHHGFGGIVGIDDFPNAGPADPIQEKYIKAVSLVFWDAYLKSDKEASTVLHTDTLAKVTQGCFRIFTSGECINEIKKRCKRV